MTARVRAPELRGHGWLNTGGKDLTLSGLRGKIVLLDFWTYGCINCLHVLDELRPLEQKYGDALVIIGVHSPKFVHEQNHEALAAAVERYGVRHPVIDDADMHLWRQYAAKAWPTLAVIDPTGYLVASMAGEGHAEGLSRLVDELIAKHAADGTLHRGNGPYVPPAPADTLLRFPGKAVELPGGNLLVSDSARHSIVELTPDGETIVRRYGSGERGAPFSEPQGLLLLPPAVAAEVGYDVVVADTVNHQLRGLTLGSGEITLVAGSGRPWRSAVEGTQPALAADLSSPWDVAWYDGKVIVAMAGIHELWWFDPTAGTVGVYAGTTVESLRDGPIPDVWMAQPSGLSVGGDRLWIADSETSALRYIEAGVLHTAVGQGLFDFGHVDGPAKEALFQHPLGVAALPDGSVLVADTYNGAVRRYDPATDSVSTVDSGLAEPSDVLVTASGEVFVVESAGHRLTRLAPGIVKTVTGERHKTERPPSEIASGPLTLDVIFTPAPGQKLDAQFGPSTRLEVSAAPPELLLEGAGVTTDLSRPLVINPAVPKGILQVIAQAATCDVDEEFPACHLTRQDWGVPVVVTPDGPSRLPLILRGMDEG
ncbi:NHL domain-containing thioredoxin family protein [Actinoplanes sp. NPDC051513]|uniref:NHL domain-containing thioredoxin family protein n=1 Tax=Actinoplanes sp. NPDC051513 TaxID=3363908 RepID=UPI003788EED4